MSATQPSTSCDTGRALPAFARTSPTVKWRARSTGPAGPSTRPDRFCSGSRGFGDSGYMLMIGQLADYAGVTVKTVRNYHERGLLEEPPRDASGYRRYGVEHAIRLVKIRTLA